MQGLAKCGRCFKCTEAIAERDNYKDEREKMSIKLKSKYAKFKNFFYKVHVKFLQHICCDRFRDV